MNETLNIVSTALRLPNKQLTQVFGAFENHQTFSQKVNKHISNCNTIHTKKNFSFFM